MNKSKKESENKKRQIAEVEEEIKKHAEAIQASKLWSSYYQLFIILSKLYIYHYSTIN